MKTDLVYLTAKLDTALLVSGKQTVVNGEGGLTRTELRLLERRGIVERLRTEHRKWKDITGSIQYTYRRVRHEQQRSHSSNPIAPKTDAL